MSAAALSLTSLRPEPPTLGLPPPDGEDIIQPSKEWVLPARGKPGRKPSATVPPTKRKAQNRASQRAFRERRHAYVTELEEKVAQFEAREMQANVQLQRLAQQYRKEADYLRQSQQELLTRCERLERDLSTCQRRMASMAPTHASGCRPPPHEQRQGAEPLESMPPVPLKAAQIVPLRRKREPSPPMTSLSEVDERSLDVDCGFCTDDTVCVCRGQARLDLDPVDAGASWPAPTPALRKTRLWHTTTAPPPAAPSATAPSVRLPSRPRPRQRLWPVTNDVRALRCTGDQRTCQACQSDPALAQFCTAVSRRCRLPVSMQRDDKAVSRESVPHAFTRLRRHPNFSAWRGGLDMLADVVARDPMLASCAASPPVPAARQRVEAHSIMVRSDAVSEVLDMLNRPDRPRACPCPWAPSRMPWPRRSFTASVGE